METNKNKENPDVILGWCEKHGKASLHDTSSKLKGIFKGCAYPATFCGCESEKDCPSNNQIIAEPIDECERCGGVAVQISAGESESVEFMRAHVDMPLLKCTVCHHEFKPF